MKYELNYQTIGKNLKKRREQLKLTQEAVGNFLYDYSEEGKDRTKTIRNHESGQSLPFKVLLKYCDIYDCDIGYLLGDYEEATHDLHFICSQTGLSEEAIAVLSSQDSLTPFIRELINEIVKQSNCHNTFIGDLLMFLMDKRKAQQYKEAPNFKAIQQIYDYSFPSMERKLHDILYIQDYTNAIYEDIDLYIESHYDYEKHLKIKKATHGYYHEYFEFEEAKEFMIAILQNELVRFLDNYSLKGDVVEWQRIEDEEEARVIAEWSEQFEEELMEGDNNGNDN